MSKPSKSPNQAKSSSSVGSVCPPTARSLSMMTAEPLTDPRLIPTALSNSVNTAIGGTPSDFESNSGLSDTSAGSGRASSATSTPKTAQAPTSPEIIMNDLRRGSLFGRQTKSLGGSQSMETPQSVTNVTWTNTDMSTASQLSSFDRKPLNNQSSINSEMSESMKTGIPKSEKSVNRLSRLSGASKTRRRSPIAEINALKRHEEQKKQHDALQDSMIPEKSTKSKKSKKTKSKKSGKRRKRLDASGKSTKSGKSKKLGLSQKSTKSGKVAKKQPSERMDPDFSKKSKKSMKSTKSKKMEQTPAFGQSGVVKKGDNSVYLPGVMNNAPPAAPTIKNVPMKRNPPAGLSSKSRKGNPTPAYNFPGAGQCTRNMSDVAPRTPQNVIDPNQSHVVYDVAKLTPAQRRFQPKQPAGCSGIKQQPKSLFGTKKPASSSASRQTSVVAPPAEIPSTGNNKIVIFGKTPDGKNMVQMTIDMQIVAGEALGASDKPMTIVPKKVIVGGKELAFDSEEKSNRQ
ncbi:hypothetical protein GCK72_009416 [Caenorhabditis remanei]|nr:hypothetical protein GCK72_009416 [Caenorhabditis remanei]KAF1761162.1 hypothetical protein GCK72_009416 [Caenorhabditis remanei]